MKVPFLSEAKCCYRRCCELRRFWAAVADNGTNTGSRCTSDEGSLQATAEYRSKSRTATASD